MVQLTQSVIDVISVLHSASSPESGGTDVFIGTTRNQTGGKPVTALSYEAFEPMALKVMAQLEAQAYSSWTLSRVSIVHRLGLVNVGEASVVIAVAAPHRSEAFEACRFLIDRLKQDVPIWKIEHFADGTVERSGAGEVRGKVHA